jgi:RNA polymerase sigma-54 factor
MIGQYLIDLVDDAGYLPQDLGPGRRAARRAAGDVDAVLAGAAEIRSARRCAREI